MDIPKLIRDVVVFHGISVEQMEYIRPYLEKQSFSKGDWVFRQGEDADGMYLILQGTVQVWKQATDRDQGVSLGELHANDCFGEMCLIDCQTRSASVIAVSDIEVYFLPYSAMIEIYEQAPRLYGLFILNLAREVSRRLRDIDETLLESSLPLPD